MNAFITRYIDVKTAVSAAAGVAGLGVVTWLLKKSDVDILEDTAKVVQNR